MGRIFKEYLSGNRVYSCNTCKAHLALHEDIISKVPEPRTLSRPIELKSLVFPRPPRPGLPVQQVRQCVHRPQGGARPHDRPPRRGGHILHRVPEPPRLEIRTGRFCRKLCALTLARYQEDAYEESQKYKIGKFILEKAKMLKEDGTWDD